MKKTNEEGQTLVLFMKKKTGEKILSFILCAHFHTNYDITLHGCCQCNLRVLLLLLNVINCQVLVELPPRPDDDISAHDSRALATLETMIL